jgi:alanyl-tRNA synthetase
MRKLTGSEIRQTYIDFFVEHGHTAVPSASLVPGGDATLLFTNSGMVQFKDVFLGTDRRPYRRAVDSQKCMRVAGKHNDLDDVGRDDTHHTFFEMLGNWSFGDYYKKEAITWAWQLLTDVWELPKERLYATVFRDDKGDIPTDEEAAATWLHQPGFDPTHLFFFGRKDNFWEMAETGPCGPCSEIHFDLRPEPGPVTEEVLDTDRFVELWNLVFIQYNRPGPDTLEPLPARHVDTGMGFERLVSILQGVDSNYKTDLFHDVLDALGLLTGRTREQIYEDFTPYRVIADHARSATFLIADGVVPGNTGRNYITRMIIRRAARFGTKIGLTEPFLAKVAEPVIAQYGSFYPELGQHREAILNSLTREEIRFARTIESGTAQLQNLLDGLRDTKMRALNGTEEPSLLDGHRAFDLYATYGLPLEIARDIAREQGLDVDEAGFRAAMDEHRLASGGGKAMGRLGGEDAEFYAGILRRLQSQAKLGEKGVEYDPYTSPRSEGQVLALVATGQPVDSVSFGDEVEVVLPKTGFYLESGGQVSDTGFIRAAVPPGPASQGGVQAWEIEITGVRRPSAGIIVHVGEVISGQPHVGDLAVGEVDMVRRHDIMRNHTATHLLHAALHQVLGPHARQAGSLVAPDRLRFDFTHPEAMTPEQTERVEKIVNDAVAADMQVLPKLKSRADAIAEGAMALFGEKYGETVRTISIVPTDHALPSESSTEQPMAAAEQQERYSYELCGGTHLERTSDVGAFIIVGEGSAAAGIRRIEAVTGRGAYELVAKRFRLLKMVGAALKTSVDEVPERVEDLQEQLADAKKEIASLRMRQALTVFDLQLDMIQTVDGVNLLAMEVPGAGAEVLRVLTDKFRERYPQNGAVVLVSGGTVISVLTDDLVKRGLKAGDLITGIGGRGGGRPNMAQGSLSNGLQTEELAARSAAALQEKLKQG